MQILKNIRKNTILLITITVIVLYFVLKDDLSGIIESLKHMDLKYIILALVFYTISVVIKGFMNYKIVNDKEKFKLKEAINQNIISQFFNGITPFQTGGEPMAIYMLKEQGFSISQATNYMVQGFIFYQLALVLYGLFAVVYNYTFQVFPKVQILQYLVLIGFTINIVVVILLLLSYSEQATKRISKLSYKICRKLKIKISKENLEKKFEDYHNGFQELKERKGLFVFGVCMNIISLSCLYMVPYFILCGMGDTNSLSIVNTLISSAYVYLIGAFVPVPGASGGIEYGFTQFYGNFVAGSIISAMLIVWRFITYYLGVIVGGICFNVRERVRK